jgi:predicted nuclease of predicted toxin-antitoxin system
VDFARDESRVIFTHDNDFLRVHAAGASHDGIVYCHPQSRSTREIISFLILMHGCLSAEDMRGVVEYA